MRRSVTCACPRPARIFSSILGPKPLSFCTFPVSSTFAKSAADRAGGIAIGAHPEGVGVLDLEEIGDLVEQASDVGILHGTKMGARAALRRSRSGANSGAPLFHACRRETS